MTQFSDYLDAVSRSRKESKKLVTADEAEARPYDPKRDGPRIVSTDLDEVEALRSGRLCGHCKHFRLEAGQQLARKERVWESLFARDEYKHNPQWYGNIHEFGLCDQWAGLLVSARAPCRVSRSFVDSSVDKYEKETGLPHPQKDEPVNCPYFQPGGSWRRSMKVYQGGGKTYTD